MLKGWAEFLAVHGVGLFDSRDQLQLCAREIRRVPGGRACVAAVRGDDVGSAHERPIAEAGVDRTAFYGSRPYAHLRSEFEQCLEELRHADERPDPRDAQVARLKDEITRLKEQAAQSDATISDLAGFRGQALARLAAQHDEITRLRQEVRLAADLRRVPAPAPSAKEQNLS